MGGRGSKSSSSGSSGSIPRSGEWVGKKVGVMYGGEGRNLEDGLMMKSWFRSNLIEEDYSKSGYAKAKAGGRTLETHGGVVTKETAKAVLIGKSTWVPKSAIEAVPKSRSSSKSSKPHKAGAGKVSVGSTYTHSKFGKGEITSISGDIVTISFSNGTKKRFVKSML